MLTKSHAACGSFVQTRRHLADLELAADVADDRRHDHLAQNLNFLDERRDVVDAPPGAADVHPELAVAELGDVGPRRHLGRRGHLVHLTQVGEILISLGSGRLVDHGLREESRMRPPPMKARLS